LLENIFLLSANRMEKGQLPLLEAALSFAVGAGGGGRPFTPLWALDVSSPPNRAESGA